MEVDKDNCHSVQYLLQRFCDLNKSTYYYYYITMFSKFQTDFSDAFSDLRAQLTQVIFLMPFSPFVTLFRLFLFQLRKTEPPHKGTNEQ